MYKTTGLTHLINSTKYSLQGLKSAFKNETAFRHECFLACILIPLAFFLGETKIEIILMISSVLLVMAIVRWRLLSIALVQNATNFQGVRKIKVLHRYLLLFVLLLLFGGESYFSNIRNIF